MGNGFMRCICCNSDKISTARNSSFFELPVKKCESCNYHFLDYDGKKFDIKKYYNETYWPVFRNIYSQKNLSGKVDTVYLIKKLPNFLQKIIEKTGVKKSLAFSQYNYLKSDIDGKKLLEIGSGEGYLLEMFEKHGYDVFGIEPSKDNLKIIKSKLQTGTCETGFVEDISKINKQYDVIVMSHVLEHVVNCRQVLKDVKSLLKNNGVFFIEVPNCQHKETLEHSIFTQPHLHHFTKSNLELLLKDLNFKIIRADVFSANVISKWEHIMYMLKWIFKIDHYSPTSSDKGNNLRIIVTHNKE